MAEGIGDQQHGEAPAESERTTASAVDDALLNSCPALGFAEDRASHYLAPTPAHRCFAGPVARAVPLEHQGRFCLNSRHARCPLWVQSPLAAAPPAPSVNGSGRVNGYHGAVP